MYLNFATTLLAEGGHGTPNALSFPVDLGLFTLVIFLGLLAVLTKFAWKPIMEGLDAREKSISDSIESAAKAKEEADSKLKQYEDKLAKAHDEAAAVLAEARQDAVSAKERILAEANEEAVRTRDRAMADIETAKSAAIQELAETSANSAVDLAGSIVGRSLKKDDHAKLIEESLKRFGS
jgi:F-type H+-transporting ATPase subunit b